MKFTLIICTYMRPKPIEELMVSVVNQKLYPDQIIIVDGSTNKETSKLFEKNKYNNLDYYLVSEDNRGLTKQRNFGITKVNLDSEIVCFLDDDTVLENDYFYEIINAFKSDDKIVGVSGISLNENCWEKCEPNKNYNKNEYYLFEGYVHKEGLRNKIRNYLGLQSNLGSGRMPEYSHGRNCGFPLSNKIYEVDLLIGMSFSFRKKIFNEIKFSTYFEGYGLYEDSDFSIRAQQFGKNVVTTKAKLYHYHDASGRPNKYQYGKMVVRNGWYVWRVKYPTPSLKARIKWNTIVLLLAFIRFSNIFTTNKRQEAATEFLGRFSGWIGLFISKPKEKNS